MLLNKGLYNAPEGNPGPAPASNIPVIGPDTGPEYVSVGEFNKLRDLVNGLNGNLKEVRQATTDGINTITAQLTQLAQPQAPAPVQTPAPAPATPQPQAVPGSLEERFNLLAQQNAALAARVQTSERLTRLTMVAPELAANNDIVALVTNSTLQDDALFNIIGGLRNTLSPPHPANEVVGDIITPPASGTEVSAPAVNTSVPGPQSPPVTRGNDIPDGVPPVNNPFPIVGETVGDQLHALVNQGDMDKTYNLINEQLKSGALNPSITLGQNQRNAR